MTDGERKGTMNLYVYWLFCQTKVHGQVNSFWKVSLKSFPLDEKSGGR